MANYPVLAPLVCAIAFATGVALAGPADRTPETERVFLAQNRSIMDRMMAGMSNPPAHDVDRDFAAMMIPHHQGAIDMAVLELRYGRNEQLRRIAQEIIVDQQEEIAAMRLAVGEPPPAPAPAPTGASPSMGAMTMSSAKATSAGNEK